MLAQQNQISQAVADAIQIATQCPKPINDSVEFKCEFEWDDQKNLEANEKENTFNIAPNAAISSYSVERTQKERTSKFENTQAEKNEEENYSMNDASNLSVNENSSSFDLFSQSVANLTIDEDQDKRIRDNFCSPYDPKRRSFTPKIEGNLLSEIRQTQLALLGETEDLETTLNQIKWRGDLFVVNQERPDQSLISEYANDPMGQDNLMDSFELSFDTIFKTSKTNKRSTPKNREVLRRSLLLKQLPQAKSRCSLNKSNDETSIPTKSNLSSNHKGMAVERELNDSYDLFASSFSTIDSPRNNLEPQKPIKRVFNKMGLPHSPTTSSPVAKISKTTRIMEPKTESDDDLILENCLTMEKPKIEDVCSSIEKWRKFSNDSQSWHQCGLAYAYKQNGEGEVITGIALCPGKERIVWISLSDDDFIGNADEELLAPTYTQLDSITVKERIAVLSCILRTCPRIFVFDLMRITKAALHTDHQLQIENPLDVAYAAYLSKSRSEDETVQFVQLVKTYARTLFPMLNFNNYLKSSIRLFSAFQALVLGGFFCKFQKEAILLHNKTCFTLEMKALAAGSRLTARGIYFDKALCKEKLPQLRNRLEYISKRCTEYAGRFIDVESPREIAKLLFDTLQLPYPGKKTKRGERSTSGEILKKLIEKHPVPGLIMEQRRICSSISMHMRPIMNNIASSPTVHPSYDFLTLTGRMLTNHPSVQTVSKEKLFEDFGMRDLFKARPDYILVSADYSQLEFRILTHMSQETTLCEAFRDSNKDIFSEISTEMGYTRSEVKVLCYGIIYGIGADALSEKLSCTKDTAQKLINAFFSKYKKISTYIRDIKGKYANKQPDDKFVSTILGRKRYFNVQKGTQTEVAKDQRQSINFTIQGTASEILKKALLALEEKLKDIHGYVILTIHDEVICEVPINAKERAHKIIRDCLENSLILSIPLAVKTAEGFAWGKLS